MRLFTVLLATAALCIPGAGPATAAAAPGDTVDTSLPTQLPRTAVPHHYAITITPHAEKLTFDGSVTIDVNIVTATRELVLNAADLKIARASLANGKTRIAASNIRTDADAQTVTFDFGRILAPGAYKLAIDYSGKINTQANGLFALDYTDIDGKPARALFTQFEAADARRFVPSWDEPDYKATFGLTARVPANQIAVSNMPAAATSNANGRKEVRFQTSPLMSTYLLFFAQGDLERIAKPAGGKEVGIVASRGNVEKGRYALDAEAQILPYYNDYFGTPYPLPKLDNVAGPGQSQFFGAMENWGAIFTFERILLLDPAITTERDRQAIFGVEAHEMAHQWFGDLVTMAWWDDLWLNEGFASWMANKTTQHFHPDWGADVDHVAAREEAMELDSFATTHPVVQSVRTVEQANQAFDAITYQKGESVISMLEGFAGPDVWRTGIRTYMKKHAYRNTRTTDLWSAMEGAGAKGLTQIAKDFTSQPGIPLIIVGPAQCSNGTTTATLMQSQFSNDRKAETAARPLSWHVPVRVSVNGGTAVQVITQGPATQVSAPGCGTLQVNPGQTGYFRTLYAPEQARALLAAFPRLDAADQYGLTSDSLALSEAGYQPMARAMDLLSAIPTTGHQKLVQLAVNNWVDLHEQFRDDAQARAAISDRAIRTYGPRLAGLGFSPKPGEPALDAVLRPTLIAGLGRLGDPSIAAEANRLFTAWLSNRNVIPGSLKETWLGIAARNATPRTWEALHSAAVATKGSVERTALYQLLGKPQNEALARRALELAMTDEPGPTVSAGIINAVAAEHPALALDFVLSHLPRVNELVDLSASSRFVARLVQESGDPTLIPKLEVYAAANLKESDRRPVQQAITKIRWKAENAQRMRAETSEWLARAPR